MVKEEEARLNAKIRYAAKIREDALFNERSALSAARREGREEGKVEGIAEGKAKIIKNLRAAGMSEEQIQNTVSDPVHDETPVIEELPEETETEAYGI